VLLECPNCKKKYNIPDERLAAFGKKFSLPCPACKQHISVNLEGPPQPAESAPEPEVKDLPTGEKLKKKILHSLKDLPPMPEVAQKARKVVSDPDSDFRDLAKVIETDQAIVSRILKIANSAYYGAVGRVASVQQASVVLGVKTLQELLTLACASGLLGQELEGYELAAGDMWQHSLAVAAASRMIAERDHPALAEDAFSAGLIHDCGKLILNPYVNERKPQFKAFMADGDKSFLIAERDILGFDHSEIASDVCEKWQIPRHIGLAIRYHHYPERSNDNGLAYILHVADSIAIMSGVGTGFDGMLYEMNEKALAFLHMDMNGVQEIMARVIEYVEKTTSDA